ncbi:GDSL-type esterase/lipase family protein [Streptomyces sp. NPDC058657]|uniref:GDSL-type esterase/lipase family protein n=1 Tax=unclassified Streptomyces TaxID=2593676 RepID=UPI0036590968
MSGAGGPFWRTTWVCVLALLSSMVAVMTGATDAAALPEPRNTWVATQNMQQKTEVWGRVEALAGNHHVVGLQEVPRRNDANGWWVPAPPDRGQGVVTQLTDRGGTGQLPALPPNVTEYRWNMGSSRFPEERYLYLLQTSNTTHPQNIPLGMVTDSRANQALDVAAAGSRRNALVLLDGQQGHTQNFMAYASYHADAFAGNAAQDMVAEIAAQVEPLGPNWDWAVLGDFNRGPNTLINDPTITGLDATVIAPVDERGTLLPTHNSGNTLDYMITSAPQAAWQRATGTWGNSGADHHSVMFGNPRGGAEPSRHVALVNSSTDLAVTGVAALSTPRGEQFRNATSQIYSLNFATRSGEHDYFHLVNQASGLSLISGDSRVVGNLDRASSTHPPEQFLWRIDGDLIRNIRGERLIMWGTNHSLSMGAPVPTEPEPSASWSVSEVDLEHLDTGGFPVQVDQPVYLASEHSLRYLRDDIAVDRVVEGRLSDHAGVPYEKWLLRASAAVAGTMYLVSVASGKCLSSSLIPILGHAMAKTEACPTAGSRPDAEERMSWQFLDGQIWNPSYGWAVGSNATGPVPEGTPLTVGNDNSTRYDLMPTGDPTVPAVPNPPPHDELKKLAVMPLGDSITLGVGSGGRTGYRPALAQMLVQDAPDVQFVGSMRDADGTRHEGHSGWRIDQISANIERWMEQAKPNLVLLHIGTNDMDRDYQVGTAPQRLAGLIDQIHASSPNTAIVVASLVPATDRTVQARVNAYNRAIPGIVADRAQRGYRVTQVSMSTLTVADLDDNLHPNDRGYRKMAASFHGGVITAARHKWIDENVTVKPAPPGTGTPTAAGDYRVDINGDGRSDYLVVEDNGAVRAWTSSTTADGTVKWADQGVIASGSAQWTGERVRFADVAGDARADYLVLAPNGAVRALVNEGGNGRGGWRDIGTIASGSAAWNDTQVRFADIAGDAKADYLIVSHQGAVRAFVNTTAADGTVKWSDRGTVATGSAGWTAEDIRFADVMGDAKADYLVVSDNGATQGYTNTTTAGGALKWVYQGYVATGSADWTGDQIRFADVTGDARAEYLVLAPSGALSGYENTTGTGPSVKWTNRGVIATGTGSPSIRVRI